MHKFWVLINYRFEETLHKHSIIWHRIFSFLLFAYVLLLFVGMWRSEDNCQGQWSSTMHSKEWEKGIRLVELVPLPTEPIILSVCTCVYACMCIERLETYPFLYFITLTKINFTLIYLLLFICTYIYMHYMYYIHNNFFFFIHFDACWLIIFWFSEMILPYPRSVHLQPQPPQCWEYVSSQVFS